MLTRLKHTRTFLHNFVPYTQLDSSQIGPVTMCLFIANPTHWPELGGSESACASINTGGATGMAYITTSGKIISMK